MQVPEIPVSQLSVVNSNFNHTMYLVSRINEILHLAQGNKESCNYFSFISYMTHYELLQVNSDFLLNGYCNIMRYHTMWN